MQRGQIIHLTQYPTLDGNIIEIPTTGLALQNVVHNHLIHLFAPLQGAALMSALPTTGPFTPWTKAFGAFSKPISRRWFATISAVLLTLVLQCLKASFQLANPLQ
ncbi:hypothetical protein H6F68_08720 [Trichocoleus sp. FACHB-262]|nr:hypothetical protein [Trichocoleus sp. FACHB-262]